MSRDSAGAPASAASSVSARSSGIPALSSIASSWVNSVSRAADGRPENRELPLPCPVAALPRASLTSTGKCPSS
jgi:hypothetical protein